MEICVRKITNTNRPRFVEDPLTEREVITRIFMSKESRKKGIIYLTQMTMNLHEYL